MPTGRTFKLIGCEVPELEPLDLIDLDYMLCLYNSLKAFAHMIEVISNNISND